MAAEIGRPAAELAPLGPERGRVASWVRFGLVGLSGLVVNQVLVVAATELLGFYYLVSAVLATVGSSTWNFVWAEAWAFSDRGVGGSRSNRYLAFMALNFGLLVLRVPLLWLLTDGIGIHYALSNAISLVVLFVLRLAVADTLLWGHRRDAVAVGTTPAGVGPIADERPARHHYDLAGILAIDSDVELRELRHFAVGHGRSPDIRIRTGLVGIRPRAKVTFHERGEELVYQEHLGPFAANFSIRMGQTIEIKVSPMLALSPHVVYTNIVEAFLRFLLVSRGYVLLHSAALAGEHGATLLSAQTDTGKTSTVITLVRRRGYEFLSDDMTIIDPAGIAICYPKPMTLSFHTMGVAKDGRLTVADRAKLSVQSRLHSKSGRQVGRALGDRNLPIMTMNSIVQFLVPPPKHRINDLFECSVADRAPIRNIVLMERGEELEDEIGLDEAVQGLLDNTDDAYGFPPFSLFAPRIRIDGLDYPELRRREAELLRSAITNARRWHLRTPGHGWADRLPELIDQAPLVAVGPGDTEMAEWVAVGPGAPSDNPAPVQGPVADLGGSRPSEAEARAVAYASNPAIALDDT
jgi:dolichol-phosphate mannosyltransferase